MDVDQVVAGRYRLAERLGGGGMGVVWRAHDERLRRTVAVKEVILPPSLDDTRLEEIRRRTMREGRIAAKLHHPQLIAVYDVIEDDGHPYLVMEYMPSTSLSRMLEERGTLPPEEVARIGAEAAAALASAHAAGVVHRDVKPANILVGDNGTVKITDFGVSRVVEDVQGTSTGTFVGTPAYLAPEVAQGKDVTFAADVYSLGATLYKAVEGTSPVGKSDNQMLLLHRIASGEVVPPKQAGPLTAILTRLLSNDPNERPTMEAARRELIEVAEGSGPAVPAMPTAAVPIRIPVPKPTPAEPVPEQTEQKPGRKSRTRAIVALAALFVVVAVTTTLLALNNDTESPPADTNAAPPPAAGSDTTTSTTARTTTATTTEEPSESSAQSPAPPPNTPSRPVDDAPEVPAAATPVAAVTDYYRIMPGNPEAGWTRLTPKFQQSPANGKEYYTNYWNGISSVRASQASGRGSTVEVTIDYSFKDGRTAHERHRYGLVKQNGRWLLDTVDVVSSTIS